MTTRPCHSLFWPIQYYMRWKKNIIGLFASTFIAYKKLGFSLSKKIFEPTFVTDSIKFLERHFLIFWKVFSKLNAGSVTELQTKVCLQDPKSFSESVGCMSNLQSWLSSDLRSGFMTFLESRGKIVHEFWGLCHKHCWLININLFCFYSKGPLQVES